MTIKKLNFIVLCALACFSSLASKQTQTNVDQFMAQFHAPQKQGESLYSSVSSSTVIRGCQHYPYYPKSEDAKQTGPEKLYQNFKAGLDHGLRCMLGQTSYMQKNDYFIQKALKLMEVLEGPKVKVLACEPGRGGAYARSTLPEDMRQVSNDRYADYMPSYPGVLFDPNMLAGNYPLYVHQKRYENRIEEYQEALKRAGSKVPTRSVTRSLDSLIFHEMLHWLGFKHQYEGLDEIVLIEMCCFGQKRNGQRDVTTKHYRQKACDILNDQEVWSASDPEKAYLEKNYHQQHKLIKKVHDGASGIPPKFDWEK